MISNNKNFISILKAKTKGEVLEIGGQSLSLWGEWTAWKTAYMGKIEKDFICYEKIISITLYDIRNYLTFIKNAYFVNKNSKSWIQWLEMNFTINLSSIY